MILDLKEKLQAIWKKIIDPVLLFFTINLYVGLHKRVLDFFAIVGVFCSIGVDRPRWNFYLYWLLVTGS